MHEVKEILSEMTRKRNIVITSRGNVAIREALRLAKARGFSKVIIQDQGGWLTYRQFSEELKLSVECVRTEHGLVEGTFKDAILLLNTMPGYAALQDVSRIRTQGCCIINDISGSIGTSVSRWGDIIIGSFGPAKPVDLGRGGFLACDEDSDMDDAELTHAEQQRLLTKLKELAVRREKLTQIAGGVKRDLKSYDIIHRNEEGINVLVRTADDKQKGSILAYCAGKGLEHTECPRYIRMHEKGVSIEIKRIKTA